MKKGHILSIVLFVLGVLLLLLMGIRGGGWMGWVLGALFGLVFWLAGLFFYRRGK